MTVTIEELAGYLGHPTSVLLSTAPFARWKVEHSVERDLSDPLFDYVFPEDGFDVVSDAQDKVATIFVHFGDDRLFGEGLAGFSRLSSRGEVLERLGAPSKSGVARYAPILGDQGAWDQFLTQDHAIHVQYQFSEDRIKIVTLMRADVVP